MGGCEATQANKSSGGNKFLPSPKYHNHFLLLVMMNFFPRKKKTSSPFKFNGFSFIPIPRGTWKRKKRKWIGKEKRKEKKKKFFFFLFFDMQRN